MIPRRLIAFALAGLPLLAAPGAHAGFEGRSSPLIPFWYNEAAPRNFILDSSRLDSRLLDSMAARLGATAVSRWESERCYERRRWGRTVYSYCFRPEWTPADRDILVADTNAWGIDTVRLRQGRLFGHYRFESGGGAGMRERNLPVFLHSAYHQDLYPAYRARDSLFRPPPRQNPWGLRLRGAVSPVWAARYAVHRDPLSGLSGIGDLEKYAYLAEGAFTTFASIAIASALIDGPRASQGRVLAYSAGLHAAMSLGVFLPLLSLDLGESMRLRASGYRLPRTLETRE